MGAYFKKPFLKVTDHDAVFISFKHQRLYFLSSVTLEDEDCLLNMFRNTIRMNLDPDVAWQIDNFRNREWVQC